MTDPQFEPTPPTPPASGAGQPADLVTRFFARLIDHVLLAIIIFAIVIPVVLGAIFTGADFGFFGGGFSGPSLVAGIVTAAIIIGYFTFMESSRGQTVGKMLLALRTEGPGGDKPTTEQAFKRNAWYAVAIVPWIGGVAQLLIAIYIAVTINNTGTGWHDTFAGGTRVVKTR